MKLKEHWSHTKDVMP